MLGGRVEGSALEFGWLRFWGGGGGGGGGGVRSFVG